MKKWLFTVLLLIVFPVMASHIVGGEFELLHVSGSQYRLNLIYYFDEKNGDQGNKIQDQVINARIFRVSDDAFMRDVVVPFVSQTMVDYTQPACYNGFLSTSRQFYSTLITLSPSEFNDPNGYYVVWERCCRNYQITNILSKPTPVGVTDNPDAAGQTFYLRFPPVVDGAGQPFINSSPHLFPPLSDYGCPGRSYYTNFAGIDDDGDSLAYSLVTPLDTHTHNPYPPVSPAPFPDVRWVPPFNLRDIMHSFPTLKISREGLLTVTPAYTGLFVFEVKVDEFRNHIKIGEVRRDFQMLVVDGCQPAQPPQIVGKKFADTNFTYQTSMAVTFDNTATDANRCIQVRVSDPDSQVPAYDFEQNVTIKVVPLNFRNIDINGILPSVTKATLNNGGTHDFSICFPACPFINGPFQIGIIAYDESCSLPLTDTLKVTVTIQPPVNHPPFFTSPTPVTAVVNEGSQATWSFQALDADNDSLIVYLITDGFIMADAGMTFTLTNNHKGLVSGQLHWDAYCNIYDFTKRTAFQVKILVDDIDQCKTTGPVAAVYNLSVKLPGVANPFIDTDLTANPHEHLVTGLVRKVNESLSFNVTGTQADNDFLLLKESSGTFALAKIGASFAQVSGNSTLSSHFQWDISCDHVDLIRKDAYEFQFVLLDSANKCRVIKTDTVMVKVTILPPDNNQPELFIQNQNQSQAMANNKLSITMGEAIALNVLGSDADVNPAKDKLTLELIEAKGNVEPKGYSFEKATGLGNVSSPFNWNPECSIFKDGVYENEYTFKFSVSDDRCFNAKADTVTLTVNIKDIGNSGKEFLPGNVITPNGDGCNDYFAVEGIDPGCGALFPDEEIALPKDNCDGYFQFIRIHNRWGKLVFESTQRNFRWYALSESSGVYYYLIQYSNHEYKGVLSVR